MKMYDIVAEGLVAIERLKLEIVGEGFEEDLLQRGWSRLSD